MYREVSLTECDDFFGWVSVLNDEIAGIARQVHIFDFAARIRADGDHFTGTDKMVGGIVATVLTSDLRFEQHRLEILLLGVLKNRHQIARRPEFLIVGINLSNKVKRRL